MQGPAPTYENMSAEELDALLSDMEPDVRAADRDMREIELLEQKGVLSAGKLAGTRAFRVYLVSDVLMACFCSDYEVLQPRLHALLAAQEHDMKLAACLEKRIATLVERHATHVSCFFDRCNIRVFKMSFSVFQVDTLSELFVAWDDVLTETESKVKRLERDKEERRRLGYA